LYRENHFVTPSSSYLSHTHTHTQSYTQASATKAVLKRDKEDDAKLAKGIKLARDKGVIPASVTVEPTTKIDVIGKTADQVANEIVKALGKAPSQGCIVVLQGLSGTGKGTTVKKLKELLPKCTTWSNGNVFRSLTLLAATWCEKNDNCDLDKALTPKNLDSFVKMLTFDKFGGEFDVNVNGLGLDLMVSKVQNTVLKSKKVSKNIPTVAEFTQGEVIQFVKNATKLMAQDGFNVLVEGRAQTLNYLRTPHRFELVLSDENVIGERRAAQRIAALALSNVKGDSDDHVQAAVGDALRVLKDEK
jgi:cytidylate kinase